jgi:hypothetical protein
LQAILLVPGQASAAVGRTQVLEFGHFFFFHEFGEGLGDGEIIGVVFFGFGSETAL